MKLHFSKQLREMRDDSVASLDVVPDTCIMVRYEEKLKNEQFPEHKLCHLLGATDNANQCLEAMYSSVSSSGSSVFLMTKFAPKFSLPRGMLHICSSFECPEVSDVGLQVWLEMSICALSSRIVYIAAMLMQTNNRGGGMSSIYEITKLMKRDSSHDIPWSVLLRNH